MKTSWLALYGRGIHFILMLAVCLYKGSKTWHFLAAKLAGKKKAAKFSGLFSVEAPYFLRRTATKPAKAEPNNHAAAGTGTAAVPLSIVTLS
jgi:hypothetical protein